MSETDKTASAIRKFNRFYLPFFHLLTPKYLNSDYSIAEVRVIYEIYEQGKTYASEIVNRLHIDKGYLSRILRHFGEKGIVKKEAVEKDLRRSVISLTETGTRLAERLIAESDRQIAEAINGLSENAMDRLTSLMSEITGILEGKYDAID